MEFEVLCSNCDTAYEAKVTRLMRDPTTLNCPQCNEHAAVAALETFRDAVEGFFEQLAELAPFMTFNMEIDSDHLPPPFGEPDDPDDEEEEDEEAEEKEDELDVADADDDEVFLEDDF